MFVEHQLETFRAAVDMVAPSVEGRPSASEHGAADRVIELIELSRPGAAELVVALLDAYAGQTAEGSRFLDLDTVGKGEVFMAMASSGVPDIRDAVDAIFAFTNSFMYSERGPDGTAAWMGYHGPVDGVAGYRIDE